MRLNRVDHTLIEMNPRRNDDVITAFPVLTDFGRK